MRHILLVIFTVFLARCHSQPNNATVRILFYNEMWKDAYGNQSSAEYNLKLSNITNDLKQAFSKDSNITNITVISLGNGTVIATTIFQTKSESFNLTYVNVTVSMLNASLLDNIITTTMAPTTNKNTITMISGTTGTASTNNSGSSTTMKSSNTPATTLPSAITTSFTQSSGRMLSEISSIPSTSIPSNSPSIIANTNNAVSSTLTPSSGSDSTSNTMTSTPKSGLVSTPILTSTKMTVSYPPSTSPAPSNLASTIGPTGSTTNIINLSISTSVTSSAVTLGTITTISTQLSTSPSSGDVNKSTGSSTAATIGPSTKQSSRMDPDSSTTNSPTSSTTGMTFASILTTAASGATQNNIVTSSSKSISSVTALLSTSTATPSVKANYSISFTNETWIPVYANMSSLETKNKVLELRNRISSALSVDSIIIFSLSQGSVVADTEITSKQSLNSIEMSANLSSIGAQLISSINSTTSMLSKIPSSTASPNNSSLPVYAIVLIAVFSALAFLIIAFILTVVICRRRKLKGYGQQQVQHFELENGWKNGNQNPIYPDNGH